MNVKVISSLDVNIKIKTSVPENMVLEGYANHIFTKSVLFNFWHDNFGNFKCHKKIIISTLFTNI